MLHWPYFESYGLASSCALISIQLLFICTCWLLFFKSLNNIADDLNQRLSCWFGVWVQFHAGSSFSYYGIPCSIKLCTFLCRGVTDYVYLPVQKMDTCALFHNHQCFAVILLCFVNSVCRDAGFVLFLHVTMFVNSLLCMYLHLFVLYFISRVLCGLILVYFHVPTL